MAYPKLQRYYTVEERTRFAALVMALSEVVELPETIPAICRDSDDDRVIACAVAVALFALVSRHKVLNVFEGFDLLAHVILKQVARDVH